jgi:hypothetical protein
MSTESKKADIREYQIRAGLTDTFGRLICNSRHHHFVVDGPAQNGCPGEALTPPEIFLAGVITRCLRETRICRCDLRLELSPLPWIGVIKHAQTLRCSTLSGLILP